MIRAAVDRGVTFFDTAEIYGPHANEDLVGEALAPFRDRVVIATKFAQDIDPDSRRPGKDAYHPTSSSAARRGFARRLASTRSTCTTSTGSTRTCPSRTFAGAVKALIHAGKVKHFGISEAAADTIRRAHAVQPVAAVQSEYSLWWRRPEEGVLAAAKSSVSASSRSARWARDS